MAFFQLYLRQRRKSIMGYLLVFLVFAAAFSLYHLPLNAVLYPTLICLALGALFTALMDQQALPRADTPDDAGYQEIIHMLRSEQNILFNQMTKRYSDMVDYYTIWAHQIKTPIASMRLQLQNEDSALSRRLSSELLRIEQYAQMVMVFLRLDSKSTDYLISRCEIDPIIRQAVRKFRTEFISRKLSLHYLPLRIAAVTDEKWLSFVIEQVLSNALKYTAKGGISIDLEAPKTLCIRDTGIGIAPEDIPRIFEKGFTGRNGREDKKASGIGLYLCRRICASLGHAITASSSPDTGTVIRIDLSQRSMEME